VSDGARRARRAWLWGGVALAVGAGAGFVVAERAPTWDAVAPPSGSVWSLLAVGDTGLPPRPVGWLTPQRAVGAAMAATDRAHPVDALALLGDNFYPIGLIEETLEEQIADNLVAPYCRFLDLSASLSPQVEAACPLPARDRRPVPVLAVLGNHDYVAPGSPKLQAEAVPEYVANWRLEAGGAWVWETDVGVSVVFWDSTPGRMRSEVTRLGEALAESAGPWRIVVSHHPLDLSEKTAVLRSELARVGVPIHLWLSGHEHNLQVSEPGEPGPALQVIAGGGASARGIKYDLPGRRFFAERLGYARVDLVRPDSLRPEQEELVVSLVTTRGLPVEVWRRARLVSRWAVEPSGRAWQRFQHKSDPLRYERKNVPDEPLE
jgi:hypothetical protein